jgi:hypothetical protein
VVQQAADDGGGDHGVGEDLPQSAKPRLLVRMLLPLS